MDPRRRPRRPARPRPHALQALASAVGSTVRCCNPLAATATLADRLVVCHLLDLAGVPVPWTEPADTWAAATTAAAGRSVVVKARDERRGRGAHVVFAVDGQLPAAAPFEGPYVVQEHVRGDGRVEKLDVAGRHLRGC